MNHMERKGIKVDCIITSPPYNTSRKVRTEIEIKERKSKYKMYDDSKPFDEYVKFIVSVIRDCDDCLKENGTILLNLSYASSVEIGMIGSNLIRLLYNIIDDTRFEVADIICWKKIAHYLTTEAKINVQEYVNMFLYYVENQNT